MTALKPLTATFSLFVIAALFLLHPPHQNRPASLSLATIHISRERSVQESYQLYGKRLRAYYAAFSAALKVHAPELLPLLESPEPSRRGYQVLPRLITGETPETARERSATYSWPSTQLLIDSALKEIIALEAKLSAAATLSAAVRRNVYLNLARSYGKIRQRQQNIEAHIQYNRLWQAAITTHRSDYDRETVLHNAVLERQALVAALKATDGRTFKKALSGFGSFDNSASLAELKSRIMEREQVLARVINEAIGPVGTPTFIHVEYGSPNVRILRVPILTDIENDEFVRAVKENIETIWRIRDRHDEFRIELAVSVIPAGQLYPDQQPPQPGDKIDIRKHLARFPQHGAVLTTGAATTHVFDRAIILGTHDVTPRVLAHEFGHILGLRDSYFRGYKDLGNDGLQVMEIVAEPGDIMGIPETGAVLRTHFERIFERLTGRKNQQNSFDSSGRRTIVGKFDGPKTGPSNLAC